MQPAYVVQPPVSLSRHGPISPSLPTQCGPRVTALNKGDTLGPAPHQSKCRQRARNAPGMHLPLKVALSRAMLGRRPARTPRRGATLLSQRRTETSSPQRWADHCCGEGLLASALVYLALRTVVVGTPIAVARRAKVSSDGVCRPASTRAMFGR